MNLQPILAQRPKDCNRRGLQEQSGGNKGLEQDNTLVGMKGSILCGILRGGAEGDPRQSARASANNHRNCRWTKAESDANAESQVKEREWAEHPHEC